MLDNEPLKLVLNVANGVITYETVAKAFGFNNV